MDLGERGRVGAGRSGERGNFGQDVLYQKRIHFQLKEKKGVEALKSFRR